MFYKNDKIGVIIDGRSLHYAARSLNMSIDFKLLREEFSRRGRLASVMFFCTTISGDDGIPIMPLVDWLSYNGFRTFAKPLKENIDSEGRRRIKGSIHVELTVAALECAPYVDHMVLFTGDGEYCALVQSLQRMHVRVSVVSTLKATAQMISDELRRASDNFIELDDLRSIICRENGEQLSGAKSSELV